MKLAIVDSSDTWYAQPRLIYEELISLGHEVLWLARPNHEGYKRIKVPTGYISICIANNLSPIDVFSKIKMELNHPPLERAYYSESDYVFIGDKTIFLKFFSERPNAFYLPYAVNPSQFPKQNIESEYEIAFIGNVKFDVRRRRLEILKRKFNVFIGNGLFMRDAAEAMNKSKIIFNTADGKEINMRIFEALSTGKMLITEKVAYLDELFEDRKHLVTYSNENEMMELIAEYLTKDEERNIIAQNGYREVLRKHTYRKRAEFIIEKISQSGIDYSNKSKSHLQSDESYRSFYENQASINNVAQERIFNFSIPDTDADGKYNIRGRLKEALKIAKGKTLDIGCQHGGYSYNLVNIGCDVTAIDISFEYIKKAKKRVIEADYSQANAESLPFKRNTFDTIILSEVIEHVADPQKVVNEVFRILKLNGSIYVTVPGYDDDSEEHVRLLTKHDLAKLFTSFKIEFRDNINVKSTIMVAHKQTQEYKNNIIHEQTNEKKPLKILLTNHHLLDFTGSEIYTYTIAEFLKKKGNEVTVYSKYVDKMLANFKEMEIHVITNLEEVQNTKFDIAHVHHNLLAAEVRNLFPDLPMVFLSHGVLPFLEQPPVIDLNISKFLAVSEEVKVNLKEKEIDENLISIFRNIIDPSKFYSIASINKSPQKALILSNKIDKKTEKIIFDACEELNIEVKTLGMNSKEVAQNDLPREINEADIVFTLGRGIVEASLCERIPFILDYSGGDGIVTSKNFENLMRKNFSGRTNNLVFTKENLIEQIKKYNPKDASNIKELALTHFDAYRKIDELINIYKDAIKEFYPKELNKPDKYLVDSIIQTAEVTNYFTKIKTLREKPEAKSKNESKSIEKLTIKKIKSRINALDYKLGPKRSNRGLEIKCEINYDIIIPIYNAYEHLERCITSVIRNTKVNHSIYLLDDASPDKRVIPLLKSFADSNSNVHFIKAESNIGFIKNVNKGFALSENNAIILNSDTEVTKNWIEKLHTCLSSSNRTGIVSPLSNNATILSVPNFNEPNQLPGGMNVAGFAKLVEENSLRTYPRIPTAVGFCMLVSREVLNKVGLFDPIFGLGYGEENDLCMRARNSGYEVACADDTYVHHYGTASFIDIEQIDEKKLDNHKTLLKRYPNYNNEVLEYCRLNPLREIQERILTAITSSSNNKPNILHVIHNFNAAGGTELHTKNIVDQLSDKFSSSVLYPSSLPNKWVDLDSERVTEKIRIVKLAKENIKSNEYFLNNASDLENELVETNFAQFLSGSNFDVVHFQHLANWGTLMLPFIAKQLGKKIILSLHDYFLLCPEYNLVQPDVKNKCGKTRVDENDPQCQYCLSAKRMSKNTDNPVLISDYIIERNEIINQMIKVADSIIAPSKFVKELFMKSFGTMAGDKIIAISHGVQKFKKTFITKKSQNLRVSFIGNATDRKGIIYLLEAAYLLKNYPIKIEIFGGMPSAIEQPATELGIKLKGNYNVENLPHLLSNTDIVLIPSIWDETFALTLSEVQLLGIPVIASKVGGMTERIIDNETGFFVPPSDSLALSQKLLELANNPSLINRVSENLKSLEIKTLEENINEYGILYETLLKNKKPNQNQFSDETNKYSNTSPKASLIILTHNQKKYTKECIESIYKTTKINFELIIIDNNSTDETNDYLKELKIKNENVNVIFNSKNKGFPAGVNQGILEAKTDNIIIANNDIVVTEGWLERLLDAANKDEEIGIVGPISNSVSGVQLDKNAKYNSIEEMHKYAKSVSVNNNSVVEQFPRVAFLCTLIKKEVIDKIGGLDERFSPGNFEDDDFCLRTQLAGYKTVIAKDVFIHHYGSVSFKQNGNDEYANRLKINEQKFIEKWGSNPEGVWLKGEKINKREVKIPVNPDLYIQSLERAFVNIDDNDYDFALENLKLALKNFSNSERKGYEKITQEDLLNMAGNLALTKNELEEAKALFEKELEVNPNSSNACFGLGEVFNNAEMYQESKTMLEWAVANDEQNQNAKIRLSDVNRKLNLPDDHNSLVEENKMVNE